MDKSTDRHKENIKKMNENSAAIERKENEKYHAHINGNDKLEEEIETELMILIKNGNSIDKLINNDPKK